jgi:hypothetical protein
VSAGEVLGPADVESARTHHAGAMRRLAPDQLSIQAGPPAIEARLWSPQLAEEVARR